MTNTDFAKQQEAIEQAEKILARVNPARRLNEVEKLILVGAWNREDYKNIKTKTTYSESHLRAAGSSLWKELTDCCGYKVSKWTFRNLFEKGLTDVAVVGDCLPSTKMYGRSQDLTELNELVQSNHCVALVGPPGVGKSVLAAKLMSSLNSSRWDCGFWKSVYFAPTSDALVADLVRMIKPSILSGEASVNSGDLIVELIHCLQSRRCLIVLDSAESVRSLPGYQQLLRRLVEESHQSCVLLTSEEPFEYLDRLQISGLLVQTKYLRGLKQEAAIQLLKDKGFTEEDACQRLIEIYGGNPLLLQIIADGINELFGGQLKEALTYVTTFYTDAIEEILGRQFQRFGDLERQVMLRLAQAKVPMSFADLLKAVKSDEISSSDLVQTLIYLERRALIEIVQTGKASLYRLNSVIKKYTLNSLDMVAPSTTVV